MDFIGWIFAGVFVICFAGLALGLVVSLYLILTGPIFRSISPLNLAGDSSINEGDFHSGPEGHSPNTAYPDAFYWSGRWDEGVFQWLIS